MGINLDSTQFSDSIKSKIRDEFKEILRLLRFNQTSSDVFRKWYVDGRMYFHLVNPKTPKKGIVGLRMIDPIQIKKVREVRRKRMHKGIEVIDKVNEFYTYNQGGFEKNYMVGQGSQTFEDISRCNRLLYIWNDGCKQKTSIGYMHKGLKCYLTN